MSDEDQLEEFSLMDQIKLKLRDTDFLFSLYIGFSIICLIGLGAFAFDLSFKKEYLTDARILTYLDALAMLTYLFLISSMVFLGYLFIRYNRSIRFLKNVPKSTVHSAPQGYCKIKGIQEAIPGLELKTPFFNIPCTWFKLTFYISVNTKNGLRWNKAFEYQSDLPIVLNEGTGLCYVDLQGAQLEGIESKSNRLDSVSIHDETGTLKTYKQRAFIVKVFQGKSFQVTESFLKPGNALYAIGAFKTISQAKIGQENPAIAALINRWKAFYKKPFFPCVQAVQASKVDLNKAFFEDSINLLSKQGVPESKPYIVSGISEEALVQHRKKRAAKVLMTAALCGLLLLFVGDGLHYIHKKAQETQHSKRVNSPKK